MTSFAILSLIALISVNYIPYSDAVACKKTIFQNGVQKFDTCEGDWCVKSIMIPQMTSPQIVPPGNNSGVGQPPVPILTYGCLSGFQMTAGCFLDTWNSTACFCQDQDMCNDQGNMSLNAPVKREVTCYYGLVKYGVLQDEKKTCKGVMCQLSYADSVTGEPADIVASCVYDLIPSFSKEPGCLLFANVLGGNDTWNCRCQTDLCNSPASFAPPTRSTTVKCGAGFVNTFAKPLESANERQNQQGQTCTGDLCTLTPMGDPPVVFSKGCVSVSQGAKITPTNFKFDLIQSTDIYACNTEMCNENVASALKSINPNGTPVISAGVTVISGGTDKSANNDSSVTVGPNPNGTIPETGCTGAVAIDTTIVAMVTNETVTMVTPATNDTATTTTTKKVKDNPTTRKSASSIAGSLFLTFLTVFALMQL